MEKYLDLFGICFVFCVFWDFVLDFLDLLGFFECFRIFGYFAKVRKSESPAGRPGTASQIEIADTWWNMKSV